MSCIAGCLSLGGSRPRAPEVRRMLASMHARAPHGRSQVDLGALSMGMNWLRTGADARESLPATQLGESVWIVADARVDDRADLVSRLRRAGRSADANTPHAELLLHAYMAWGRAFAAQLLGDFSFAIWDGRTRELLLGRDPFGVRRLYWHANGERLLFASEPDTVAYADGQRLAPSKSAMANFLLVGSLVQARDSMFEEVSCVAPAHVLVVSADGGRNECPYWELRSLEEKPRVSDGEALEEFKRRFEQAVRDRLPGGATMSELTGGMDSTAIAAVAAPALADRGHALYAQHTRVRRAGDDEEARLTQLVADHLSIPLSVSALDDWPMWHGAWAPEARRRVPTANPFTACDQWGVEEACAKGARVILSGHFGDTLYLPDQTHCAELARRGRWLRLSAELWRHWRHSGSLRGLGLRTLWPGHQGPGATVSPDMPDWLTAEWREEFSLDERWGNWWDGLVAAHSRVTQLRCQAVLRDLERADFGPWPAETRFPFLDLRLVDWAERLPNRWLSNKRIARVAMNARLPQAVLSRPKAVVPGDPVREMVTVGAFPEHALDLTCSDAGLDRIAFIRARDAYRAGVGAEATWMSWFIMAPIGLGVWMHHQRGIRNERNQD